MVYNNVVDYFFIFRLALSVVILITHSTAVILLCKVNRKQINWNLRLLLFNLTIAQLMYIFLEIIKLSIKLSNEDNETFKHIYSFLSLLQIAGLKWVTSGTMILLALDRFFEIYWNIKYSIYFSTKRVKLIMSLTWTICAFCIVTVGLLVYRFKHHYLLTIFFKYVHAGLNMIYVLVIMIVYGYLFQKFYENRLMFHNQSHRFHIDITGPNNNHKVNIPRLTVFRAFKESNFYLPTLLIFIYLFLFIIPGLAYALLTYMEKETEVLFQVVILLCTIAIFLDPLIVVFALAPIKNLIFRKLFKNTLGDNYRMEKCKSSMD